MKSRSFLPENAFLLFTCQGLYNKGKLLKVEYILSEIKGKFMRLENCFKKLMQKIKIVLVFEALFLLQCNLFGPEPGDPAFPAPIDPGDSVAVRAILDSNNLKNINVRRVIDPFSKGRVTTLRLDSLSLDSFKFINDFQKLDSFIGIDLSNNKIAIVNVPESLKFNSNIVGIDLGRNLLSEFPIGVLKIKGLLSVGVEYNKISTISHELIGSGFRQINFSHNNLCSVSDTVKLWLDSVQNNWANFQNCP